MPGASRLDTRPPVQAASPPPAISGGNLLVTHDGKLVVVADFGSRSRAAGRCREQEALGRLAAFARRRAGALGRRRAAGRVHVALRGGGSVVTLDLASRSIAERRVACSGPRGIAADDLDGNVIVACADGKLVTLPSAGGPASASVFIGQRISARRDRERQRPLGQHLQECQAAQRRRKWRRQSGDRFCQSSRCPTLSNFSDKPASSRRSPGVRRGERHRS